MFENTGFRGAVNFACASALASAGFAPAMSGEWNPHATAIRCDRMPAACSFSAAAFTPSSVPAITVCVGELWLAIHTSAKPFSTGAMASAVLSAAIIPPGAVTAASRIARPRLNDSRIRSSSDSAPAAASAAYSP